MQLKVSGIDHKNMKVISFEEFVIFYNNLFGFDLLKEQPDDNSKIIGNEKLNSVFTRHRDFKATK